VEIPIDKIFWRWADFAKVRTVPTPFVCGNGQAFLLHQSQHDFFRES
jgi:hypothetical protein